MLLFLVLSTDTWAQSRKPPPIAELSVYNGLDREQLLYAGAKSEGKVTWYTSLAGDSYKALARAFESKYPGVRLEAYRAGGSELVPRMIEEAKARRPVCDVLEITLDSLMVLRANNLLRPYSSPHLATYPEQAREKADKGLTFWAINRLATDGNCFYQQRCRSSSEPTSSCL